MALLESDPGMTMLVILAIVAFVGFILGLRWFAQRATTGINRAIHKGQHVAGQKAAGTSHLVIAHSLTPEELLTAVWKALPYPASQGSSSLLNSTVYKTGGPGEGGIVVAFGKKYIEHWSVIIGATDDGVGYIVNEARMSDGLVVGAKELVDLERLFLQTVRRVDVDAMIETDADKVVWK